MIEPSQRVFKDRTAMTPCMVAFEKWWLENAGRFPGVAAHDAWSLFMHGYWAGEEAR